MTITTHQQPVHVDLVAGVDTHSQTHTMAILTITGKVVSTVTYPADHDGYQALISGLRAAGNVTVIGVEGTGSYGAGLTRALTGAGYAVKEVLRPSRQTRRLRGKSDPIDAVEAARAVIAGNGVSEPKDTETVTESLRLLLATRTQLIRMMTVFTNTIKQMLITAPEPVRARYRDLPTPVLMKQLAATRPSPHTLDDTSTAAVYALRTLARSRRDAEQEATDLEQHMHTLIRAWYPQMLTIYGAGTISAAKLIVTAGGNPTRIRGEAAFAALCGVSPIPASSGKTTRYRLNRGGDRRGNSALHRIALVRMQHDPTTREYTARRKAEGKSTREILRCLKRAIAREVYRTLTNNTPQPEPINLRTLRQQHGLTLADAAKAINTTPSRISDIELQKRPLPTLTKKYQQWLTTA